MGSRRHRRWRSLVRRRKVLARAKSYFCGGGTPSTTDLVLHDNTDQPLPTEAVLCACLKDNRVEADDIKVHSPEARQTRHSDAHACALLACRATAGKKSRILYCQFHAQFSCDSIHRL
ncbi:hypothetical protein M3J07_002620 [Ascochyta lentis]